MASCVVCLCFGQKEERLCRLIETVCSIARILGKAHYFQFIASGRPFAEVLAEGIFILEKLARKRLVNDCHMSRSRSVLLRDAAPFEDTGSNDVKVSRCYAIPRGGIVILGPWRGVAFD